MFTRSFVPVVQQLQSKIVNQQTLLAEADESYIHVENQTISSNRRKKHKPEKYVGKRSITSWSTHASHYVNNSSKSDSLPLAVSNLTGAAHEWRRVFNASGDGRLVQSWKDLRNVLVSHFETLKKKNIARAKLAQ